MQQKTAGQSKKTPSKTQNNVLETLKNIGSSVGNYPYEDDFDYDYEDENYYGRQRERFSKPKPKKEVKTLFNQTEYLENQRVQGEIRELIEQIKQEIEAFKKTGNALMSDVKDIEKVTVESLPSKPGVYHVRFLETLLSIIRTLRLKIGESKTWLEALMTKKKKRGSLFAHLSKKKGTQYSLSQELQTARSVQ